MIQNGCSIDSPYKEAWREQLVWNTRNLSSFRAAINVASYFSRFLVNLARQNGHKFKNRFCFFLQSIRLSFPFSTHLFWSMFIYNPCLQPPLILSLLTPMFIYCVLCELVVCCLLFSCCCLSLLLLLRIMLLLLCISIVALLYIMSS